MINDTSRTNTQVGTADNRQTNASLIDSHRVEGTKLFDPGGKDVGTIKRLVIDKASGRVVYTVATFGGFLGMGASEYTIPWNALDYDPRLGGFRTNITKEQLEGAPAFSRDGGWNGDTIDREHERALYDYYDQDYYW